MSLQYLTNSSPPPTRSVLQYSVSPDTVFVSTATQQVYANLTLTVFNPSTDAVTCQMFHFGFYVGAQPGLVAYFDFSQLPFQDTSGNNLSIQLSGDAAPIFQQGPCESPSEKGE